jgi:hypothetical protein
MPVPSPDTLSRRSPFVIVSNGQRHSLGWTNTRDDGPCFAVVRLGDMKDKVLERFPLTQDGWAQAWAALLKLDPGAAQAVATRLQEPTAGGKMDRQARIFEAFATAGGATEFQWLGVQVLVGGSIVYTIGSHNTAMKTNTSLLLGPLAGAQAMVTDGSQAWSPGRAMLLPVALTGMASKTMADAAVVFPDGTVHTSRLNGNYAVREAQKQVVQFNALAGTATPAAPATGSDPAARLRKLQELLDADLLTQDEYEAKRTEIITSI